MSKGTDGNTGKREQIVWTPQMDSAFIRAMVKEQDKGNRLDGTFTPKAYSNMVEELSRNLNKDINKGHLKNRLKTIKKHVANFYDVFHGGFSWNPVTKLLEAKEEVWDELIANNPDVAKWKTKPISNYNELRELFGKDRVIEAAAAADDFYIERKRWRNNNNEERIETIDEIDQCLPTDDICLENFMDDDDHDDDIQVTLSSPNLQKKLKKCKKNMVEEQQSAIAFKIMDSIQSVAHAMEECTKAIVGLRPRVYSEDEIFNELELMGVGDDVISKAYLFLVRSPENTRALFGCPRRMRMAVLNEMMGASN
ncbi:uncharacterized protein [Rutidosis leptorrhynchoides]|uniref:uncharacterized protein n=1 Tax=Rutidosis leptorrhynchoides TaxID=125765 RepID=UPI003A99BF02